MMAMVVSGNSPATVLTAAAYMKPTAMIGLRPSFASLRSVATRSSSLSPLIFCNANITELARRCESARFCAGVPVFEARATTKK